MDEVRNPFLGNDDYKCFGCDPDNPIGLAMTFTTDGTVVESRWEPQEHYQGYTNVLHGGIQATLMDEIASWYVFRVIGSAGMTRTLSVTYHKPARTDGGTVHLRAIETRRDRKSATIHCTLEQDGELRSEATCEYAVFSPQVSMSRFAYPGAEAFIRDSTG